MVLAILNYKHLLIYSLSFILIKKLLLVWIEVGGTFNNGPMVKIDLASTGDSLGTLEEFIMVGFKSKSKKGILMQMLGEGKTNYIIVRVNNNGGITIEFDVGFGRFEVTTDYIVDLSGGQHHTVKAWRTHVGQVWHLQVRQFEASLAT